MPANKQRWGYCGYLAQMPSRPNQYQHAASVAQADRMRATACRRGYGRQWRRLRAEILAEQPLCAACLRLGRRTEASEVDHKRPHRGDPKLFWNRRNLQALCKPCHSRKTAKGE